MHLPSVLASPGREERMLQGIRGFDPLLWVESQASFQKVYEMIQIPRLRSIQTLRGCAKPGAQIASWLHDRKSPDRCLPRWDVSDPYSRQ